MDGGGEAREPAGTSAIGLAAVFVVYASLSVCFFGWKVVGHPSRIYIGQGHDPAAYIWSLVWWPYSISHRLNPFLCKIIWAPTGTNLTWAVAIPGLGILAWPITYLFGPVVAFNGLCLLAPALSAWTAFILCRYLSLQFWPSLVGGYVFGFSSYVIGQMLSHVSHALVFAVPLAVYLVLLMVNGRIRRYVFILSLAALLTIQFLISTEIFATMTFFGALAIALAFLWLPKDQGSTLWLVIRLITYAYGLCAVFVAPYLYYALAYGEPTPLNPVEQCSTDLLNFIVPTRVTLLGSDRFNRVAELMNSNLWYSEKGAYLGPGLLIVFLLFGLYRWTAMGKLLASSALLISLCALGPRLHLAGAASIALPWKLMLHLPLIDQALPIRFPLYLWLIAAIVVALVLSAPEIPKSLRVVAGSLSVLFILPNLAYMRANATDVDTPAWLSSKDYQQYISAGDTLLVLPFGARGNSMLWQAQTGMYFTMAGGYISSAVPPEFARWPMVMKLYDGPDEFRHAEQLRPFLAAHKIKAIVIADEKEKWRESFAPLGITPISVGEVSLYILPPALTSAK